MRLSFNELFAPRAVPVADDYLLTPEYLSGVARAHAAAYRNARPFPHAVIDEFLPKGAVDKALEAFPGADDPYWTSKQKRMAVKQDSRRIDKELLLPPFLRRLMWELNSAAFLLFLTELTGIEALLADPYLEGGGVHQIPPGGYLKIHADFNKHPLTNLDRRLNVLIYLNKDWKKAWGGDLELWPADMKKRARAIAPLAGRCVIFSTTGDSFHGHPEPLACPPDRTRKSIALYYYTAPREGSAAKAHSTLYKRRPQGL